MRSAGQDERDGGNALTPTLYYSRLLPRILFPTPRLVLSPSNRFPRRPAGGFHLAVLALVSRLRRYVPLRHRIFLPLPRELHFPQRELPLFQLVARDRSFTRAEARRAFWKWRGALARWRRDRLSAMNRFRVFRGKRARATRVSSFSSLGSLTDFPFRSSVYRAPRISAFLALAFRRFRD